MQIIDDINSIPAIENAIVTSGTFDGVHYGHKKILKRLVNTAKKENGKSVVLTFWPHPRLVLFPEQKDLRLLSTFEEKAELMAEIGIDYLVKIRFTREFSELTSAQFIQSVIVEKLKTKKLIIGYDHKFGKNREGSFEYLKENCRDFGFEVEEIASQDIDDVAVSSTKIRRALEAGDVDLAATYLGRHYELEGVVVEGHKLGTKIGFPTANIHVNESTKLIPEDGVYVVYVRLDGKQWGGMLNIGSRPTIENAGRSVEVNIFGLEKEIYNQTLKVEFIRRLRDESKFDSIDALKNQLAIDKTESEKVLSKMKEYEKI